MSVYTYKLFHFSPTSNLCQEILPTIIGFGLMDKVENINIDRMEKFQSKFAPDVVASFLIH